MNRLCVCARELKAYLGLTKFSFTFFILNLLTTKVFLTLLHYSCWLCLLYGMTTFFCFIFSCFFLCNDFLLLFFLFWHVEFSFLYFKVFFSLSPSLFLSLCDIFFYQFDLFVLSCLVSLISL